MAAGIVGNVEKGQKRPRRRKLKIGSERPPIAAETTQDDTNRCGKANGSETSEEQMEKSGELGLAGPQPEKPYFFYMPKYFIHKMTAAIAAAECLLEGAGGLKGGSGPLATAGRARRAHFGTVGVPLGAACFVAGRVLLFAFINFGIMISNFQLIEKQTAPPITSAIH